MPSAPGDAPSEKTCDPCHVCGGGDFTPGGRCRTCRDELAGILAERSAALPPCSVCGAKERSPRGGCRACARERQRKHREYERSPEGQERKRVLVEILTISMPETILRLARRR